MVALLCLLPERHKAAELLFRADFDSGLADASLARGNPRSTLGKPHPEKGRSGNGRALLLNAGERCQYDLLNNFDLRRGTLSFWVRAYDWIDGEARSQVFFYTAGTAGGEPFEIYIDSPVDRATVRLVVALGRWGDTRQKLLQLHARVDWRRGWQKVDVTWDAHSIAIYGNGELGDEVALETVTLSQASEGRFELTPPGLFSPTPDRTLIDDVEVWSGPLLPDRVRKRFLAETGPDLAPPEIAAPRWRGPAPVVDGLAREIGWSHATRVPLLADAEHGFQTLVVPFVSAAWSPGVLYLMIESPVTGTKAATLDAFDIELQSENGPVRRLRVTPKGAAGQLENEFAAILDKGAWAAEIRIPLERNGLAPRASSLGLRIRQRSADPGGLGVGALFAGSTKPARLLLLELEEGIKVTVPQLASLDHVVVDVERREGARARLAPRTLWRRTDPRGLPVLQRGSLDSPIESVASVVRFAAWSPTETLLAAFELRSGPMIAPGVRAEPDAQDRSIRLRFDLDWLDGSMARAVLDGSARLTLKARAATNLTSVELVPASLAASVKLREALAQGKHELILQILGSGGRGLAIPVTLAVPELPWLQWRPPRGDRVVPEPWQPVRLDEIESARVWDRQYRFDGPLLVAAEGGAGPLLRGQMSLQLRTVNGADSYQNDKSEVVDVTDARVSWRGTGQFPNARIQVSWSRWLEFDGFTMTRLELAPREPGQKIEELTLEIPVRAEIARWLRGTREGSQLRGGRLGGWDGRKLELRFEPFLWLTDDRHGFLYLSPSDANWIGADRVGAVAVRGGPNAAVTLRIIRGPVSMPPSLVYEFGFQATPVKPQSEDARSWNFGTPQGPTPGERAISWYDGYATQDGLWEVARPRAARAADSWLSLHGSRPFYYATVSATPSGNPTFRLFERVWRSAWSLSYMTPAQASSSLRPAVPDTRLAAVCPASGSFQQRMLYDAERLLRDVGALGLYTDTDEVFADDQPIHGCGYVDAFGRRGVTWTFLEKRSFAKSLANLVRSAGQERRYWMSHAHNKLVPPVHGLADFWLPGEELAIAMHGNPWFYADELDAQAWRADYRSEPSGLNHIFLPQFGRGTGRTLDLEETGPTESLVALAAVNDVNLASMWANRSVVAEFWRLRRELGLNDAPFVGYWRADCPVRSEPTDTFASVYRPRSGPVFAIANPHGSGKSIRVIVDWKALDVPRPHTLRDRRSGALVVATPEGFSITLPGRSYAFLSVNRGVDVPSASGRRGSR